MMHRLALFHLMLNINLLTLNKHKCVNHSLQWNTELRLSVHFLFLFENAPFSFLSMYYLSLCISILLSYPRPLSSYTIHGLSERSCVLDLGFKLNTFQVSSATSNLDSSIARTSPYFPPFWVTVYVVMGKALPLGSVLSPLLYPTCLSNSNKGS